ncbi:MAG: DUF1292 domain-containing protein [Oscillospiraceae bacterium]|nr:DUF1292 domain-containing protein [Oscillospiraceae bacterium]
MDDEFSLETVVLKDEEGVEHEFEIADIYEHDNGLTYAALMPVLKNPDEILGADSELIIMKIVSAGEGEEILEIVDDDDEFDEIGHIFMERLEDLYDFDDEDFE